jgi:hypothetical protein
MRFFFVFSTHYCIAQAANSKSNESAEANGWWALDGDVVVVSGVAVVVVVVVTSGAKVGRTMSGSVGVENAGDSSLQPVERQARQ